MRTQGQMVSKQLYVYRLYYIISYHDDIDYYVVQSINLKRPQILELMSEGDWGNAEGDIGGHSNQSPRGPGIASIIWYKNKNWNSTDIIQEQSLVDSFASKWMSTLKYKTNNCKLDHINHLIIGSVH